MSILFNPYEVYIPRRTSLALSLSMLGHALIFMLGWHYLKQETPPAIKPSLSVILVNKKSMGAPDSPEALAQANLNGSGNTDEKNQQTRTLIVPPSRQLNEKINVDPVTPTQAAAAQRAGTENVDYLTREEGTRLHSNTPNKGLAKEESATGSETKLLSVSPLFPNQPNLAGKLSTSLSDKQTGKQDSKMLGASTREYRFASYFESWAQKMERVGTQDYRNAIKTKKLYSSTPIELYLRIRANGELEEVRIIKGSGNADLDALAVSIAKRSSPFNPFPDGLRAEVTVMEITRAYTFTGKYKPSKESAQ